MIQSPLDILLLLIILYNVLRGWQTGFVFGLLDLLSWAGSLLVAFRYYDTVAGWLVRDVGVPEAWSAAVGFALTAMVVGLVIGLVARALAERLSPHTHTSTTNRFLGLFPGLVNGFLVVSLFASLLLSLPLSGGLLDATRNSALANRFAATTQTLETALAPIFGDAISETLNMMTIHPESDELVELPYTVTDSTPAPDLEAQMLTLINQERASVGLPALAMDTALTDVARQHSGDMFMRGYFAHTTPEGVTPFDRIQAADIPYLTAGENLAHAPTLSIAHNGLMNSPGHRANILRPEFGRVGIGILDGGPRGLMITQNFRD
jgi:uncharacterized protein YkwD/uncharacterized membrane protein required for colicin V production